MTPSISSRISRREIKRRRLEIEHRLVEFGLATSRIPRVLRTSTHPAPAIVRLRAALQKLGPTFSYLARYLSTRMDLLSEQDSLSLAIPDSGPPAPPQPVAALLTEEFAQPLDRIFAAFEPVPTAVGLLTQEYRAQLISGEPVTVQCLQPGIRQQLDCDLELLPTLTSHLAPGELQALTSQAVLEEFAMAVRHAADLSEQAAALTLLRHDGAVSAPWVASPLTTSNVIVREWIDGPTLDELFPSVDRDGAETPEVGPRSEEIAHRLTKLWLRQIIDGQTYPVELDAKRIVVANSGQRIVWTGGSFAQISPGTRRTLWQYLLAVADQDPDSACGALLDELDAAPNADPEALRRQIRQLVPFRDAGWGAQDDLASYLFLQWRRASALGFQPRPPLVGFYRSIANLAAQTRRLAWRRDPLLEGLQKRQTEARLGEFGQLLDPRLMGQTAEDYLRLMLTLPQKLDRVLTHTADGPSKIQLNMAEPEDQKRRKDSSSAVAALLLAIVAVVLLADYTGAAQALGAWGDRAVTAFVVVLGMLLLRALGRRS